MRTRWSIAFAICAFVTHAQNWALLNPAYRYNYSNDGSDTISNQIRVLHVDTLGVDSIRYALNLIGELCDTCTGTSSNPCNGCFIQIEQPQFIGYDCIRSANEWTFQGSDTILIRTNANIGASWVFNATDAILATVDTEWVEDLFNVPDTLQRILLSNGDSIILSRSFGIVSLNLGGEDHYELIGVEGPDVGVLLPDPLDYFDFEVGDELTYRISSIYWVYTNQFQYPQTRSHYWTVRITGRNENDSSIHYTTSTARTFDNVPMNSSITRTPDWPIPNPIWSFDRAAIISEHPMLDAYPGQVLYETICWGNTYGHMALAGISEEGRRVMRAQNFGSYWGRPVNGFYVLLVAQPGIFRLIPNSSWSRGINTLYEVGIGLREVKYWESGSIELEVSVVLVGAILSGDTVIEPPTINWTVGMEESSRNAFFLLPNPADRTCSVSGLNGGEHANVFDLEGRVVISTFLSTERAVLDVSGLAPGTYVVTVEGLRPQRLIIAR